MKEILNKAKEKAGQLSRDLRPDAADIKLSADYAIDAASKVAGEVGRLGKGALKTDMAKDAAAGAAIGAVIAVPVPVIGPMAGAVIGAGGAPVVEPVGAPVCQPARRAGAAPGDVAPPAPGPGSGPERSHPDPSSPWRGVCRLGALLADHEATVWRDRRGLLAPSSSTSPTVVRLAPQAPCSVAPH